MLRISALTVCGLAFVAAAFVTSNQNMAEARPWFPKVFVAKYENISEKATEKKCGVCHPGKSKKDKNDYGVAVGKALGAVYKKKTDEAAEALDKALDKAAEQASSTEGKTFGDLIKAGELPGTDEVVKMEE